MTTELTATTPPPFPYTLEDLDYFILEREDGTVVKFTLDGREARGGTKPPITTVFTPSQSLSTWCKHDPAILPVFEMSRKGTASDGSPLPPLGIWIADGPGTRSHRKDFDLVIDGGNVLTIWTLKRVEPKLEGDAKLCGALEKYAIHPTDSAPVEPRILQIDWFDRAAPPLKLEFWPDLAKRLLGDPSIEKLLVNCQGGHGRSGSMLVALMMCYTDYTSLDAITHLRAIHCARAIESTVQHEYLAKLSEYLGRPCDWQEAQKVPDWKARFLTMTSPYAAPYQKRLKTVGGDSK